jgi:hypothetical protein
VGLLFTRLAAVEAVRGILALVAQAVHLLVVLAEHRRLVLLLQRIPLAVAVAVQVMPQEMVVLVDRELFMSGSRYDRSILRSTR